MLPHLSNDSARVSLSKWHPRQVHYSNDSQKRLEKFISNRAHLSPMQTASSHDKDPPLDRPDPQPSLLCYHPPRTTNHTDQDHGRQETSPDFVASSDVIRIEADGALVTTSTRRRIALTDTTRVGGDRTGNLVPELRLDDLHGSHLFSHTNASIKGSGGPLKPALLTIGSTGTGLRRCFCGCLKKREQKLYGEGCSNHGCCHPASQIGFERTLINVTFAVGLASNLVHDIIFEEHRHSGDYATKSFLPYRISASL